MLRPPPIATLTATLLPTRRSSDLPHVAPARPHRVHPRPSAGLAAGGRAAADREPRGGAGAAVGAGAGTGRDRAGRDGLLALAGTAPALADRKSTRLNSSH